jgi:uridine kinase
MHEKKEGTMTATTETPTREKAEVGQDEFGEESAFGPLLLAAMLARREERGEEPMIEHPLLLAALMGRREERGEDSIVQHPLLLAALMRRREERSESLIQHPLLLAALMRRS